MAKPRKTAKQSEKATRTCLLVLGMHRSGTSVVTRLVSMLGATLPRQMLGTGEGNETGHWEPERLIKYHDQMLAALGSTWHDWVELDFKTLPIERREQLSIDIADIVSEDYGESALFVLKEPRIARFANFFSQSLSRKHVDIKAIVTFRNPLDVIESLFARQSAWPADHDRTDAALLWLSHMLSAEKSARDWPHAVVSYEKVLTDPAAALQRVISEIGIKTPISVAEAMPDIATFISEDHRHHAHRPDDVLLDPQLAGWVADSYAALRDLEARRNLTGARETLDRVHREFQAAMPMLKASTEARRETFAQAQSAGQHAAQSEAQSQQLMSERVALTEELERVRAEHEAELGVKEGLLQSAKATAQDLSLSHAASEAALIEARDAERDALSRAEAIEARFIQSQAEMEDLRGAIAQAQEQLQTGAVEAEQASQALAQAEAHKTELEAALAELKAEHAAELSSLQSTFRDEQEALLSEKNSELATAAAELAELKAEHAAELSSLQSAFRDEQEALLSEKNSELATAAAELEAALAKLKAEHAAELSSLQSAFRDEQEALLSEKNSELATAAAELEAALVELKAEHAAELSALQSVGRDEMEALVRRKDSELAAAAEQARQSANQAESAFRAIIANTESEFQAEVLKSESLKVQIEHLHQLYTTSTSWQLTKPMRSIANTGKQIYRGVAAIPAAVRIGGGVTKSLSKARSTYSREGLRGVWGRIMIAHNWQSLPSSFNYGPSELDPLPSDIDLRRTEEGPKFTIVIPTYNTPEPLLEACIASVRSQIYQNWELIIVDDNSKNENIRTIINRHENEDARIKSIFRKKNGHISAAINTGLEVASGTYFTVLDHDDTLESSALYWVALTALNNRDAVYIYSDEDKMSEDGNSYYGPFHKPGWSPEYMLAMMYTCHMSIFTTEAVRAVGGYRSDFDGAQDYDLTLRVVAGLTKPGQIVNIQRVLYHWRSWENSTASSIDAKPYAQARQIKAIESYLDQLGDKYSIGDGPLPGHHAVVFQPRRESKISIVIPTANGRMEIDGREELHIDAVIENIETLSTYGNYEIVVVHNGNLSDAQVIAMEADPLVTLVHYDSPVFSLSAKINMGCAVATGEYLLILNDDIRVISKDWLERMLGMAQRDGVGAVGAKLLFPDRTIQHAGVVMLGGLPGHAYYGLPEDTMGYALGALVDRGYIAVTGACQMTPRSLFLELGGYDDFFPLNYNDVDYCLRLHEHGYRSVCLADVKLFHYEGVSKEGGRAVSSNEIEKFLSRWGNSYKYDPYYNPNLSQTSPYGM